MLYAKTDIQSTKTFQFDLSLRIKNSSKMDVKYLHKVNPTTQPKYVEILEIMGNNVC